MRPSLGLLFVLTLTCLLGAAPAFVSAQSPPEVPAADGDGVTDHYDACPGQGCLTPQPATNPEVHPLSNKSPA